MEFKRDDCKFSIPDRITVKKQLEYFSAGAGLPMALRHWEGAKTLVESWECEKLPKFDTSLDDVTDPSVTNIVIWAGAQVVRFINSLDEVPKN